MFGISATEFLIILLVTICVVPGKYWPDVIRFFARGFKYIRNIIWKISDFSNELQERIELEKPIDDLIQNATNNMFAKPIKKKKIIKRVRKK